MAAEPGLRRRVRVAAYAVIVDEEQLLLSRFIYGAKPVWTLPGGGLDHGEDPLDAVVREVAEETGYDCAVDRLLGIDSVRANSYREPPDDMHGVRIFYQARIVGGTLTHEADGSTDRAEWFPLDRVDALDRGDIVALGLALCRDQPVTGKLSRLS